MRILLNLLALIALFLFARWFVGVGIGAPFLPIRKRDIDDALSLITLTSQDVVVDLGSGDGRILVAAADKGATVIGYELNPFLVWFSRLRLRRFGDRAHVYRKNLLQADLKDATVIFVFGITSLMPKIVEMLDFSQKSTISIISFAFDLPGLVPIKEKGIVKLYQK